MAIVSVPYRRVGGKSKTNEYHVYEPGEEELVSLFQQLFSTVEVRYQYFEETWPMSLARTLHLRRLLGLHRAYADLSAGTPAALEKLHIHPQPRGMKLGLIVAASGRKPLDTARSPASK
jgi:hypothetical protein